MKKKKVGLVLGSGGSRGFCHIGILEVLQENGISIDIITGCSMGALVGGAFASGLSVQTMHELAMHTNNHTVFDVDFLGAQFHGGFAKGNRAMKMYREYIGDKLIEDCDIKFACIATDLKSKEVHVFDKGTLWEAIRSSISIPGIFRPMHIDDKVLVDGCLIKRMPISEARALGADIIIAVDAMGSPSNDIEFNSAAKVIELSLEILEWKTARHERHDADVFIEPDMGNRSILKFKDNEEPIRAGREAAIKALPQILKLLGR